MNIGSGKVEQITITNDQHRLSLEDIQQMIKEGEEFAEQVCFCSTGVTPTDAKYPRTNCNGSVLRV